MLHVFIDTNILTAAPRRDTAAFQTIERLAGNGCLVVHLSEITVREFTSQEEAHFEKSLDAMRAGLRDVQRRGPTAVAQIALEAVEAAIAQLNGTGASAATFREWISRLGVIVHELQPQHGREVMDGYFAGCPPFKSKKSRADIPDAFIFQALKGVVDSEREVQVVVSDGQLRQSATALPGVTVYESLDALIVSPAIQDLVHNANAEQNLALLGDAWQGETRRFESIVRGQLVDALVRETIESPHIPDDNSSAMVTMVDEAYDIEFTTSNAKYYGDGCVLVPFAASVEVLAAYSIFKNDFYILPNRRTKRISISDCNDHYFDAEESLTLRVSGTLSLHFDETLLESRSLDVRELAEALGVVECSIDDVVDSDVISHDGSAT